MALTPMGMAPGVQLTLKQQQSLVMTPQLQQAIKMLQLGRAELASLVEEALATNPLLEQADPSGEASGDSMLVGKDGTMTRISQDGGQAESEARGADREEPQTDAGEEAPVYPLDWREEQRLEDGAPTRALSQPERQDTQAFELHGATNSEGGDRPLDFAQPRPSLQAHISQALPLMFDDRYERKIAEHLCLYLSPAGYLEVEVEALAAQLGIDADVLERIIVTLQQIEPAGLFARSLSECLRLQLQDRGALTPLLGRLLADLEAIMAQPRAVAAEALGCSPEALAEALASLRRLDPKPGASFELEEDGLLEADIFLRPAAGGDWLIELNTSNLPRLLVNHSFVQRQARPQATGSRASAEPDRDQRRAEQSYISEQWQSATWLISALEQRATTLLRVAGALVDAQAAFFEQGLFALRPLSQRQIAERLDLHESTISRVCANKYMSTPRGTFELKFFFSSGVGGGEGEDEAQSAKAVQAHIKRIIDQEDRNKPLSDDKIVKILEAEKIGLARRTVTKYREALGFASSVQRKRQYAGQS
jgi:RNA polymerase sigma-54 factor